MNGIQEAIDAISSATWAELLADGVEAIIFIAGLFMLMRLGKRMLRMAADAYGEEDGEHPADFIDQDGQVWENGEPTGEHADEADECPHCGRETFGDACYCSEGNMADSMESAAEGIDENGQFVEEAAACAEDHGLEESDKAGFYEEYHELLDNGDAEAARQLADEHGLDVDWDQHTKNLIQEVIDRGDFALADSMCDEAGIDKLELDWH